MRSLSRVFCFFVVTFAVLGKPARAQSDLMRAYQVIAGKRFVDLTQVYDAELGELLARAARTASDWRSSMLTRKFGVSAGSIASATRPSQP